MFAWIGWRGSVRSADWSPGNGMIPRVGRRQARVSCGSRVSCGFGVSCGFASGGGSYG